MNTRNKLQSLLSAFRIPQSAIRNLFPPTGPVVLCVVCVLALTARPAAAQDERLLRQTLLAHGVPVSPPSLVSFLAKGWSAAKPPKPLPEDPPDKSNLLIDAWKLLSLEYEKVAGAPGSASALSSLALRYAQGDLPAGPQRMIEDDLNRLAPNEQATERTRRLAILRYNGMMALGVFGMPTPDVQGAARAIYDAEADPVVRVAYARTLALLGDRLVVDDLVAETTLANSTSSVAAAGVLYILCGRSFAMTDVAPVERRREAAEAIVAWRETALAEGSTRIDREAALERMAYRPPEQSYPMRALRDLLRAAADVSDFADKRGSRTAWNRLDGSKGPDLAKQLLPIVRDRKEDLDIRCEAMRWYRRVEGKGAKRVLKKLRKDPNPEVSDLAKALLAQPVK